MFEYLVLAIGLITSGMCVYYTIRLLNGYDAGKRFLFALANCCVLCVILSVVAQHWIPAVIWTFASVAWYKNYKKAPEE